MSETLRGHLLIAAPSLFDYFRRTVVLVIEHTAEGAMGVVLNRESETRVADAVPQLADLAAEDDLVRIGGPVAPESVVALGEFADLSEAGMQVVGQARHARPRVRQRVAWPTARLRGLRRLGRGAARRRARAGGLAGRARRGGRSVQRRGHLVARARAQGRGLPAARDHAAGPLAELGAGGHRLEVACGSRRAPRATARCAGAVALGVHVHQVHQPVAVGARPSRASRSRAGSAARRPPRRARS